jgi:SAM-dependent methyltransferase
MGFERSFDKAWKARNIGLAVLIIIALQVLGEKIGWSQEPAPPQIKEEITKQDKIYRSRGAEVPKGYVTGRALSDYVELLPAGFCDALGTLGSSDRWLDIGAGEGQAILDYYAPTDEAAAVKCSGYGGRARAVALSIEDRRTDKWRQQAARLGDDRIRYLSGKRLRDYSRDELGKYQIITDVYGGFSYTEDLSIFLEKVLSSLETGGVFFTMMQSVHLEHGKDKPSTRYETELIDGAGHDVKVCSWLKQATCALVGCDSKSDWDAPTELINVRKLCSDVSIPRLKLLNYEAGNPPSRRFQLDLGTK